MNTVRPADRNVTDDRTASVPNSFRYFQVRRIVRKQRTLSCRKRDSGSYTLTVRDVQSVQIEDRASRRMRHNNIPNMGLASAFQERRE